MHNYIYRALQGLFILAFIAIAVTGAVISLPKYKQTQDLEAKKAKIARQIEEKRAEIQEIKEKQNRFNTDREFVESLARQNRRVFPGELVFVFDD